MVFSKLRNRIYRAYVTFNPEVRVHYEGYKASNPLFHQKHKLQSWRWLRTLRKYYMDGGTGEFPNAPLPYSIKSVCETAIEKETDRALKKSAPQQSETTIAKTIIPESMQLPRLTPVQFSRQLLGYDVISFDVFDTLIFRPFQEPFDLFDIVGAELNIPNFKALRRKAEKAARDETLKQNRQVDIYEIYKALSEYVKIDIDYALSKELEVEKRLCFANPYMKQVFSILLQNNKEIIALSDMYWPENILSELLACCGYKGFLKVIVSCDLQAGKADGQLQKRAQRLVGTGKSFVHVGDNFSADVAASRKTGWNAIHYTNVNTIRRQICGTASNSLDSSVYQGIVAAHIHNGLMKKDKYYQHGFICGGIMVEGYCEFLENLAQEKNIDKFLFVSRDGNIIWKIYQQFFHHISSEYIMWSRVAANICTFEIFTDDILTVSIKNRISAENPVTVEMLLEEMFLQCVRDEVLKAGFSPDTIITEKNYHMLENVIYANKDRIVKSYENYREAAKRYFSSMIKGCRRICIVDIGWRGTTLIQLKSLINKWFPEMEVFLSFAGLKGVGSSFSTSAYLNNQIFVYLFSNEKNRDIYQMHMNSSMPLNNILMEILFGVPQPSFIRFDIANDGYLLSFSDAEIPNFNISRGIQQGIIDFVKVFHHILGEYRSKYIRVSPYTAYLPLYRTMTNPDYIRNLFSDYEMNLVAGIYSDEKRDTIGAHIV